MKISAPCAFHDFKSAPSRRLPMDGGAQLIYGDDESLVRRRAEEFIGDGCEVEILNGRLLAAKDMQSLAAALEEAISALPLFGGKRSIWVRSISFLSKAMGEEAMARFEKICNSLKKAKQFSVAVLLSACPVDGRLRAFKLLKSCCIAAIEVKGGLEAAEEVFESVSNRLGLKFNLQGRKLFMAKIGKNVRSVAPELEKLDIYIGERKEVHADDVSAVVCDSAGDDFFEPVEAFYQKNLPKFISALHRFFAAGGEPRSMLAALQSRNRILLQLKAIDDTDGGNPSPGNLSRELQRAKAQQLERLTFAGKRESIFSKNHWYLCRLLDCGELFSPAELLQIQTELLELFGDLIAHWQELSTDWLVRRFVELFRYIA